MDGRSLFLACEFKEAARTFERGLADQPESAFLYYWAGKSYARLAEVSVPSRPESAHKAAPDFGATDPLTGRGA